MATVLFYEKPGCINNTRQKRLLARAGHRVVEQNLLETAWNRCELRKFFGDLPVEQWFNPSSPAIKNGEVNPALLDEAKALQLMLADPLLIRRPLMQVNNEYMIGFNPDTVEKWIGLGGKDTSKDLESCPSHN